MPALSAIATRLLIAITLLGGASITAAAEQIFRSVDENGNVVFSDTPPAQSRGAEPVDLPEMNEYPSQRPVYRQGETSETPPVAAPRYAEVKVVSPHNDEAIRNNAGSVHVEISSDPVLAPGHTLQLIMDGEVIAANTTGSFDLSYVDRGTHRLEARIIDDATGDELARSEAVTFHLLRHFKRPTR